MVSTDKIFYYLWKVVLVGQSHAVSHVTDDNLCTLLVAQLVMRVHARLIFGKEGRVQHFPNIMIHGSRTYQLAIGPNTVGSRSSQIRQLKGMLECARCHFRHLTHQFIIDIG